MWKVLCKCRNTLRRQSMGQSRLESESSAGRSVSQLMGVGGRGLTNFSAQVLPHPRGGNESPGARSP